MFQPLSAFIGLRYTKAKKDNNYISFISMASVFGIALGIIVLISVLSIMNGFVKGIQERHLGMLSHITVSNSGWSLPEWENRREQVLENTNTVGAAPFIERYVMLKDADKLQPIQLQGVLPEFEKDIGTINRYIKDKKGLNLLKKGEFKIILGEALADSLDVTVGDSITMLAPNQLNFKSITADPQEQNDLIPIIRDFEVVSTFKVGFQGYDKSFAYVHLDDAAELFDMNNKVNGLRVQISDIFTSRAVSEEIASKSLDDFFITDWTRQHSSFFRALQLQKTMLFLVLLLIIGVAAFNLISTLIMVVTDKESDIAILRTLGMPPTQIMKIFIIQGALLALVGTIIGVVIGLLVASNISEIVTSFLNADIHGITHIDAEIQSLDVILIAISAFLLSVGATLFPAWKASKVQPAEALRYE